MASGMHVVLNLSFFAKVFLLLGQHPLTKMLTHSGVCWVCAARSQIAPRPLVCVWPDVVVGSL